MTNIKAKAAKKVMKAVYMVDRCVNHLNENGCYDLARAAKKAQSYQYWIAKTR